MGFKVRALEVGFFTSWEAADVVPPAREVSLWGAPALTWGHVHWGRGQGQKLSVANSYNILLTWRGLRLRNYKHHSTLSHRRAHKKRLGKRGGLRKDGLLPSGLHLNMGLNNCRDDASLSVYWKHLAKHWRTGYRRLRHGMWGLWCRGWGAWTTGWGDCSFPFGSSTRTTACLHFSQYCSLGIGTRLLHRTFWCSWPLLYCGWWGIVVI